MERNLTQNFRVPERARHTRARARTDDVSDCKWLRLLAFARLPIALGWGPVFHVAKVVPAWPIRQERRPFNQVWGFKEES